MYHELKTINPYFKDVLEGKKKFEVRLNDRKFSEGDQLKLLEYNKYSKNYTGNFIIKIVSYVLELNTLFDITYSEFWSKDELEEFGIVVLGLN